MGFLDEVKQKAEQLGEKAKEGLEAAKDKAEGLVEDIKDRFDHDDGTSEPTSAPTGPDTLGTDVPASEVPPTVPPVDSTLAPDPGLTESQPLDDTVIPDPVLASEDAALADEPPAPGEIADTPVDAVQEESEEIKPDPQVP